MRQKTKERSQAIDLRKQGKSLSEIQEKLGVARSTVSVWVRDVELSDEQRNRLDSRKPAKPEAFYQQRSEAYRAKRQEYQQRGRDLARKFASDRLFIAGCMLYWAEGSKAKNSVIFCNSDADMMRMFIRFLLKYFDVTKHDIRARCNFYTDIHSQDEVESYWQSNLSLPESSFTKSVVDYNNRYSKRQGKLEYGTCSISIHSTELVQIIFGSISEIAEIEGEKWLD
tara:strand:+ start:33589 stop:34266 length:678 start_codon:yes stop_codon:yes gene_type:complete